MDWTAVASGGIGLVAGVAAAAVGQVGGWVSAREQRAIGTMRIRGLLREARYYVDRGANEIQYKDGLGIYQTPWNESVSQLYARLDAGEHTLNAEQVLAAYTAAFRCKETVFASSQNFGKAACAERVAMASQYVIAAQEAIGDSDPCAYFKGPGTK